MRACIFARSTKYMRKELSPHPEDRLGKLLQIQQHLMAEDSNLAAKVAGEATSSILNVSETHYTMRSMSTTPPASTTATAQVSSSIYPRAPPPTISHPSGTSAPAITMSGHWHTTSIPFFPAYPQQSQTERTAGFRKPRSKTQPEATLWPGIYMTLTNRAIPATCSSLLKRPPR
jgi:hypothetical protein